MQTHDITLKQGPSGIRAACSCGWAGYPRYTDEQANTDAAKHLEPLDAYGRSVSPYAVAMQEALQD